MSKPQIFLLAFLSEPIFRSFGISVPAKFVDNQIESEDESELNIDLDMLQVPLPKFTFVNHF